MSEQIPNTPYQLYSTEANDFEVVNEALYTYNLGCVPPTQSPELIKKYYIIKENDKVIAGIYAVVYTWKILFVDRLYVDDAYRGKDLGSLLLNKVEADAKAVGAKLAHLDTFDFQAKGFYEKQGYQVFGVLDDCPEGHKRYYLKKVLPNP
ncbi:MAG: GNAT family N-acetyltransferase [Candidatus Berkiella sp.]